MFLSEGKTEVVEHDFSEQRFHAILRVGSGGKSAEDLAIERWWREVITTVLYNSAGEPWQLHICTEYRLNKEGGLGYIWNFLVTSENGIAAVLPSITELINGVTETAALDRVPIDSIRVGTPGRNIARGTTRYGKPSMKGAVATKGSTT